MLVLLPPSEGKTVPRRGRALDLSTLSFPDSPPRARRSSGLSSRPVRRPMRSRCWACHRPSVTRSRATAASSPRRPRPPPTCTPASSTPLSAWPPSTPPPGGARTGGWSSRSALFGAVRPTDRIPAYRLSMKVNLPPLGPLAGLWRDSARRRAGRARAARRWSSTAGAARMRRRGCRPARRPRGGSRSRCRVRPTWRSTREAWWRGTSARPGSTCGTRCASPPCSPSGSRSTWPRPPGPGVRGCCSVS